MSALKRAGTVDLEFLLRLDTKLHSVKQSTFKPNIRGNPFPVSYDTFTDAQMSSEEIARVLELLRRKHYIFPINTAMGLAVGFQIRNLETKEALLTFKESQLPQGYDFARLSGYFMRLENMERASVLGVPIINDRSRYDY